MIQILHFIFCNQSDIFALWPRRMGAHVDLPSSARYVDGWLWFPCYTSILFIHKWLVRIVVAVNSPMRVDARSCMNFFGTSDCKYYRRQLQWDEWRRVSHCLANWWAFLFFLASSYCLLQTSNCHYRKDVNPRTASRALLLKLFKVILYYRARVAVTALGESLIMADPHLSFARIVSAE